MSKSSVALLAAERVPQRVAQLLGACSAFEAVAHTHVAAEAVSRHPQMHEIFDGAQSSQPDRHRIALRISATPPEDYSAEDSGSFEDFLARLPFFEALAHYLLRVTLDEGSAYEDFAENLRLLLQPCHERPLPDLGCKFQTVGKCQ